MSPDASRHSTGNVTNRPHFAHLRSPHLVEFILSAEDQTVPNGGFVADDLEFLGRGIPDLVTELCPPQDTA